MHCVHAGWHEYSLIHFVFESDAAFSVVSKLFCTSFVLSSSLEFLQAFIGCPEKKHLCCTAFLLASLVWWEAGEWILCCSFRSYESLRPGREELPVCLTIKRNQESHGVNKIFLFFPTLFYLTSSCFG